jgi:hypothetical protein
MSFPVEMIIHNKKHVFFAEIQQQNRQQMKLLPERIKAEQPSLLLCDLTTISREGNLGCDFDHGWTVISFVSRDRERGYWLFQTHHQVNESFRFIFRTRIISGSHLPREFRSIVILHTSVFCHQPLYSLMDITLLSLW